MWCVCVCVCVRVRVRMHACVHACVSVKEEEGKVQRRECVCTSLSSMPTRKCLLQNSSLRVYSMSSAVSVRCEGCEDVCEM